MRKREVDVLLTTSVAGYAVRFGIECKNEATPIGSPKIDGFIGKLQDVGIPAQQGIFISASGYTKGAARRAEKAGIRALLLRGLSTDGLKASILNAAYRSIVYFMVVVDMVEFITKDTEAELPLFVDGSGRLCSTVPHLIHSKWRDGTIPVRPGTYDVALDVSPDWRVADARGGLRELIGQVQVKLKVCALAATLVGKAETYSIVDASSHQLEKLGLKVFFETPEGRHRLTSFEDEASLDRFLASRQGLKITQRVKVPRIHFHSAYWPLSRRAAERIRKMAQTPQFVDDQLVIPSALEVEGLDIAAAWETPMTIAELDEWLHAPLRRPDTPTSSDT